MDLLVNSFHSGNLNGNSSFSGFDNLDSRVEILTSQLQWE